MLAHARRLARGDAVHVLSTMLGELCRKTVVGTVLGRPERGDLPSPSSASSVLVSPWASAGIQARNASQHRDKPLRSGTTSRRDGSYPDRLSHLTKLRLQFLLDAVQDAPQPLAKYERRIRAKCRDAKVDEALLVWDEVISRGQIPSFRACLYLLRATDNAAQAQYIVDSLLPLVKPGFTPSAHTSNTAGPTADHKDIVLDRTLPDVFARTLHSGSRSSAGHLNDRDHDHDYDFDHDHDPCPLPTSCLPTPNVRYQPMSSTPPVPAGC
eukprot:gnl/Spiro4/24424_TR12110_c0_g1_i1.p1 gnl/Spiro4/24424_TR12110_c0_g1~~gnl/Spiro4/24424_TR12110_c0_g1_i1.p1  ORF type:complete len:268 (+),score=60.76 gnl/Spiro4/24424_TR12110_c0_g1_i1:60-863(+)